MKISVLTFIVVLLHISLVCCFIADNDFKRMKRSNETQGFTQKVKSGLKVVGSKVSNVAVRGYEEVKNLFSSKRKVGDYQLNNIDVRVGEEEDYEEVGVKRSKRDVQFSRNMEVSHNDKVDLDEIAKDIKVLQTTESENNF